MQHSLSLRAATIIFLVLIAALSCLQALLVPRFENGRIKIGEVARDASLPLYFTEQWTEAEGSFTLRLSTVQGSKFLLIPDDCLEGLQVNGQTVVQHIPFCDWKNGRVFDLGGLLHSGNNSIVVRLKNNKGQGSLEFNLAPDDPALFLFRLGFLGSIVWYALIIVERKCPTRRTRLLAFALVVGVVIRIIYFYATPYWVRAYDWTGHISYIRHVYENWSIPYYRSGWQNYQPPLYYFVCATWLKLLEFLGLTVQPFAYFAEWLSLLFALVAFALELGVIAKLFPEEDRDEPLALAGLFLAVFPGLVMFTPRIGNDPLYHLLAAASLYLLSEWWKMPTARTWFWVSFTLGLGLLTKSNAVALIFLAYGLLLFRPSLSLFAKAKLLLLSLIVILGIAGWYFHLRFYEQGQPDLVGNIQSNPGGLRVDNGLDKFTTFDPLAVLSIPYNHTWDDGYRRAYFWEFLYRSMFFGEFRFGEYKRFYASTILFFGYAAILLAAIGLFRDVRERSSASVVMLSTILLMVGSLVSVRYKHNISGFSDFRYIPLAAVPLSYYAARGLGYLRGSSYRAFATVFGLLIIHCGLFVSVLYFSDYR